ncbi:hypothetical protein JEP40_08170 [Proteus vulgaris]|uniref:hypothetical protein n=1 Tax=Proteus vulgaris TaxID=585 RepID=UPI0018E4806D|nr:hypothetical protein [Proteus vulgaris]MBI6529089.1 hypothetical protein [Proteus vulgaris]
MSESFSVKELANSVNELKVAVAGLSNNDKIQTIRLEMLGSIFSALIATGALNRDAIENIINLYDTDDKQFSKEFLQEQKEAMIGLMNSIKVR